MLYIYVRNNNKIIFPIKLHLISNYVYTKQHLCNYNLSKVQIKVL